MLIDELRELLKKVEPDLDVIKTYFENSKIEEQFNEFEKKSLEEDFWQNPQRQEISKKLQKVRTIRDEYYQIMNNYADSVELIKLFETDEDELQKLKAEIEILCRKIIKSKINLLLDKEEDNENCFLSINAGAGGTESQDWSNILLRMYLRFCEREGLTTQIVDYQPGEEAGIKSATLYVRGKNVFGLLKTEHGVHRLVRISPFDSNKRRHTSFSAVHVIPEVAEAEIKIDPKDLRVDTYRSSGAGGQHVNKTESAIRITHLPTNIVVQCQIERSQIQNRETAMKMLMARLAEKQKDEQEAKLASVEKKKIEWGSQIRSYVLHPYKMIKDHRTDYESPQPDLVLDGDLMPFIETSLLNLHKTSH